MLIVDALMRRAFRVLSRIPTVRRSQLIAAAGMVLLLTPLGLWMAMTVAIFKVLLGIWCIAFLIIYVLVWSSPDERI